MQVAGSSSGGAGTSNGGVPAASGNESSFGVGGAFGVGGTFGVGGVPLTNWSAEAGAKWDVSAGRPGAGGEAGASDAGQSGMSGQSGAGDVTPGPLLLAGDQTVPVAIAIDQDNVYWLNLGTVHSTGGRKTSPIPDGNTSVMKCSRQGCNGAPTALAANRTHSTLDPGAFAFDGRYVYWSDVTDGMLSSIVRCSIDGCPSGPEVLLGGAPYALAADANHLYGVDFGPAAYTCDASACADTFHVIWQASTTADSITNTAATDIAVDGSEAYISTLALEQVLACGLAGCGSTPRVVMPPGSGLAATTRIALDGDNVYVADTNGCEYGGIAFCPKSGCVGGKPTVLVDSLSAPTGLASDGNFLYFTDLGGNHCDNTPSNRGTGVYRCAVNGCPNGPTAIATGFGDPYALAVDEEFIFVADAAGSIWRLPK